MKIIIEDCQFSYAVDWSKFDKIDGGFVDVYMPSVEEAIDAVLRLLENCYSKEAIADCLASGELPALDYSERGVEAREKLRG